jgi:hypothetical protein
VLQLQSSTCSRLGGLLQLCVRFLGLSLEVMSWVVAVVDPVFVVGLAGPVAESSVIAYYIVLSLVHVWQTGGGQQRSWTLVLALALCLVCCSLVGPRL